MKNKNDGKWRKVDLKVEEILRCGGLKFQAANAS